MNEGTKNITKKNITYDHSLMNEIIFIIRIHLKNMLALVFAIVFQRVSAIQLQT